MQRFDASRALVQGTLILIVLLAALFIRSVTAGLNRTVGTVWPFSLNHCYGPPSPGCRSREWRSDRQPTR